MQPLWYGDRRDRVKWGALVYLADEYKLNLVVQVAYCRDIDKARRTMEVGDGSWVPIPEAVWKHFSDLQNIRKLGRKTGKEIIVIDMLFEARQRREYVDSVVDELRRFSKPKLLFLDPDTGIEPKSKSGGPGHTTVRDIERFWAALRSGDVLAVYQHAPRRADWVPGKQQLQSACQDSPVHWIRSIPVAGDVAMLWAQKGGSTDSSPLSEKGTLPSHIRPSRSRRH